MTDFVKLARIAHYCDCIGCYELADTIHVKMVQAQNYSGQSFGDRPMTAFADPENWMGADTAFGQSTGIYDPSNPYHSPTTGNDSPNYRPLFQGKTRADWDQYQSEAAQWAAQQQSQQAAQFRAKSAKYEADNVYYQRLSQGYTPEQAAQYATKAYYDAFNTTLGQLPALPPEIANAPRANGVAEPGFARNDGFGN